MDRKYKKYIWIVVVVIVVAGIITAVSLFKKDVIITVNADTLMQSSGNMQNDSIKDNSVILKESYNKAEVKNLDLECTGTNIFIEKYDGDTVNVELGSDKAETWDKPILKDGTLTIKEDKNSASATKNEKANLVIQVPSKMNFDKVTINSKAGAINISSLQINSLNVNLVAGNINFEDSKLLNTNIKLNTGNIILKEINGNTFDASTQLGNFIGNDLYVSNTKIDTQTGNLILNNKNKDYKYHSLKTSVGVGFKNIN